MIAVGDVGVHLNRLDPDQVVETDERAFVSYGLPVGNLLIPSLSRFLCDGKPLSGHRRGIKHPDNLARRLAGKGAILFCGV